MMKKNLKITGVVLSLVLTAFLGATVMIAYAKEDDKVYDGIFVGELSVGGMSKEEAQEEIEDYVTALMSEEIILTAGDKEVSVDPEQIGLTFRNTELAEEAFGVGRTGNLVKRYVQQKELQNEAIVLPISFDLDEEALKEYLEENASKLNQEAIDNGLKRENGQFVFIPGQEGRVIDVDASVAMLEEFFSTEIVGRFGKVELVSEVSQPRGSQEELAMVKDVLGSFSTDYSTSAAGRCANVQNATGFINGTIIYPGEQFSVHDTISPITRDNGYELAGAYENGTVVESVGGGVCQVSSTLYNAIIRAEVEVVERFPHSMVVSYVQPSQDAAIAGDYKDFKFRNNLEHPIYIEGYTENKHVYFNVYGVETRASNRVVTFETEIESTDEPEIKIKKVEKAIGHVAKIQDSHTGYQAVLYKIVTVNGKVESKEVFNRSTYNASPTIYEVGTASSDKEAVKAIKEAIKTNDLQTIKEAASYWSDEAIAKRKEEEEKNKESEEEDPDSLDKSGED